MAEKKKTGRPRVVFDLVQVAALGGLQCTNEEVAAVLGVSRETVQRRIKDDEAFATALETGRENGKTSLRRLQWKSANGGHVGMQIWLGKQWLNQRDRSDFDINATTPSLNVILSGEGHPSDEPESQTP